LLAVSVSETVSKRCDGRPGNQYWAVNQLGFGLATIFAVESLDTSGCVNQLLFAREEWVTT